MLKDKIEFIYKLDDKYYLIGRSACEEIKDEGLIAEYEDFMFLANRDEFMNTEVWDIDKELMAEIKKVYDGLYKKCTREYRELGLRERLLMSDLEKKYPDEIKRQIEIWTRAR